MADRPEACDIGVLADALQGKPGQIQNGPYKGLDSGLGFFNIRYGMCMSLVSVGVPENVREEREKVVLDLQAELLRRGGGPTLTIRRADNKPDGEIRSIEITPLAELNTPERKR